MSYHIHRLRCFLALLAATWAEAGSVNSCSDCRHSKDIARKRWERQQELGRQLIEMRKVRP